MIGIGGDPVVGTGHIDCLAAFQDDPDTDLIALIGEIGEIGEDRRRRGGTRRRPHP
ncbi:succinyl-CoA synthetase alpha subunit [Streptomyces griseoviridis]|uniref:Succinyl-CoA synthetase alpha subunit n=1 Tax=Streptomyces griseoviridis TaxID=45398 RepID=A0ABT9LP38_STRGD|nr:succinyl-CoA synthetase alpha subunit [Streptomyces griseoviridis]